MLGTVKESSQNALECFFPKAGKGHIPMSQQAFSAARQKIQWEALEELFQTGVSGSYRGQWERRHGYRLTAADGSFIRLPSNPELTAYYGGLGHEAAPVPLLYDLENGITADVKTAGVSESGRAPAERHLETLNGLESFRAGEEPVIYRTKRQRM